MNENIIKARDDLAFAGCDLLAALNASSGAETMVLLRIIKQVADARTDLEVLMVHMKEDAA